MGWLDAGRRLARKNETYLDLRRLLREGFFRAFRRHRLWRKILWTAPVRTAPHSASAVEVHALCYRLDHLPAIWSLKSFYRASEVDYPLVIHVNSWAERSVYDRLRKHFPDALLLPQQDADKRVEKRLAGMGLWRLAEARRASPFMLKLTDFPLLASGEVVLGIDSDVMFFSRPGELLERCARPNARYVVQTDPTSNYNLTAAAAVRYFGIPLAPRVNTGLLVYPRELPDMQAFERYLANPDVARPSGFIEQTLYALHGSELGRLDWLESARYQIDLRAGQPYEGVVARHYAGSSRPLMTAEGMPKVAKAPWFDTSARRS